MASGDYVKTAFNNGATPAISASVLNNNENKTKELDTSMLAAETAIGLKAPIASPTFTGTPTLPTGTISVTQSVGDSSTTVASTAFVQSEVAPLDDFQAYNASRSYALNAPAFYLGVPYKSLQADNAGHTPDSSPTWWEITGGGGSAVSPGYDFVNGQIEGNVVGYNLYADAAGVQPVDGTGGTANITFVASATLPLVGTGSGLLSKDANNRQGQGVSKDFTIDRGLTGTPAQIKFLFETDTNYVSADMKLFVIETSTNTVITPNVTDIPTSYGVPQVMISNFFPIKDKTAYRLCWHVASVSALAYTMKIDDITVGSKETIVAPAISDWQAYTPTFQGFGTPTAVDFKWRRNGSNVDVKYKFTTGTTTAVEARIGTPSPLTSRADVPTIEPIGTMERNISDNNQLCAIMEPSKDYFCVGNEIVGALNKAIASSTFVAGQVIAGEVSFPCAQFSVNTSFNGMNEPMYLANSNQTITADDTGAGTVSGQDGALIPSFVAAHYRDLVLPRIMQPNEVPEFDLHSIYGPWGKAHATVSAQGNRLPVAVESSQGLSYQFMSALVLRVYFGATACINSAGSNESWDTFNNVYDRWRVRIGQAGLSEVTSDGSIRAWVSFNGITGAIYASSNVSSITKIAVGRYRINFTRPMPHDGYFYTGSAGVQNGGAGTQFNLGLGADASGTYPPLTTSCVVSCGYSDSSYGDATRITVQVVC